MKSNWREVVVEGSEVPLIADHQTWFRKDGHVRHLKRCQDRYRIDSYAHKGGPFG